MLFEWMVIFLNTISKIVSQFHVSIVDFCSLIQSHPNFMLNAIKHFLLFFLDLIIFVYTGLFILPCTNLISWTHTVRAHYCWLNVGCWQKKKALSSPITFVTEHLESLNINTNKELIENQSVEWRIAKKDNSYTTW